MLEFHEKYLPDGRIKAILVSDELKAAGSTCSISQTPPGWDGRVQYIRKTCNGSAGSTRYQTFSDLERVYADSRKWAKRKIAAHQKDQKLRMALIIARFVRALGNPQADSDGYIRNPNRRF